jgi:hypothetical protein
MSESTNLLCHNELAMAFPAVPLPSSVFLSFRLSVFPSFRPCYLPALSTRFRPEFLAT